MAHFGSKLGVILATAGSAVGLGNIWRFPTTTGENGGAAFIIIYIMCTLMLGVPGMLAEFIVGRNGACNSARAYREAGGHKVWSGVGIMGTLCSSIILGFYSVVAGWCIYYLYAALCDGVLGDKAYIEECFAQLQSSTWIPMLMSILFILLTHGIIVRGVQGGIEKASKILMPVLFLLLLILVIASCSLPGAYDGITFLFNPDFSKITTKVAFEALGQAFFSLSLGTACLCTYASYFKEDTNLLKSSMQIISIDVGVAILAGLMIFPAAFSVGIQPDAGPSLIFLTLPNVFNTAFPHSVAYVISIVFYALLTLAALTSTISMHEIGTAVIAEQTKLSRSTAAICTTLFCCVIGVLSALSLGPVPMGLFGAALFDNFDALTSNILLPTGAFLTCIIVGWIMPREKVVGQLTSYGLYTLPSWFISLFLFLVRFVCPTFITLIFITKVS